MPVKQARPRISLPSGWHGRVKSAVLHTISLAHFSIVHARGMAAGHIRRRVRLSAHNERLREECALLREEIRIKDARMRTLHPIADLVMDRMSAWPFLNSEPPGAGP